MPAPIIIIAGGAGMGGSGMPLGACDGADLLADVCSTRGVVITAEPLMLAPLPPPRASCFNRSNCWNC